MVETERTIAGEHHEHGATAKTETIKDRRKRKVTTGLQWAIGSLVGALSYGIVIEFINPNSWDGALVTGAVAGVMAGKFSKKPLQHLVNFVFKPRE